MKSGFDIVEKRKKIKERNFQTQMDIGVSNFIRQKSKFDMSVEYIKTVINSLSPESNDYKKASGILNNIIDTQRITDLQLECISNIYLKNASK